MAVDVIITGFVGVAIGASLAYAWEHKKKQGYTMIPQAEHEYLLKQNKHLERSCAELQQEVDKLLKMRDRTRQEQRNIEDENLDFEDALDKAQDEIKVLRKDNGNLRLALDEHVKMCEMYEEQIKKLKADHD